MIGLPQVYILAGALFAVFAGLSAFDRRWPNAAFWALLAASFLLGDHIGDIANGVLVLGMVLIGGLGGLRAPQPAQASAAEQAASAQRRGNWLFLPALRSEEHTSELQSH